MLIATVLCGAIANGIETPESLSSEKYDGLNPTSLSQIIDNENNQQKIDDAFLLIFKGQLEPSLFNHGDYEKELLSIFAKASKTPSREALIEALKISGPFFGRGFSFSGILLSESKQEFINSITPQEWCEIADAFVAKVEIFKQKWIARLDQEGDKDQDIPKIKEALERRKIQIEEFKKEILTVPITREQIWFLSFLGTGY